MKKTLIALGAALSLLVGSIGQVVQASEPVDQSNPYQLIEQVAANTFSRLRKDRTLFRADPDLLRDVVKDELLPYIHTRYAASLVLGHSITARRRLSSVMRLRRHLLST